MAQLTLTERNALAEDALFRGRVFQGLFAKANFYKGQSNPANLKEQKQQNYAQPFLIGGANSIDVYSAARTWLANYNVDPPVLDSNNQPIDDHILNGDQLNVVYDGLAGVKPGDELLPIE
jgi:hypothetical protein